MPTQCSLRGYYNAKILFYHLLLSQAHAVHQGVRGPDFLVFGQRDRIEIYICSAGSLVAQILR